MTVWTGAKIWVLENERVSNRTDYKMNKLDNLLAILVSRHAANLGLSLELRDQMVREMAILAERGYNSRAELILLTKKAIGA